MRNVIKKLHSRIRNINPVYSIYDLFIERNLKINDIQYSYIVLNSAVCVIGATTRAIDVKRFIKRHKA